MKTLTTLLFVIVLAGGLYENASAQNLLKSTTYNVVEYKIEKVTGKKESHVYPDVTALKVELGEDVFGNEFTNFSFVNAAREQSFMAWYKEETIHENNIVQKLSMLDGEKSKPTMAYFFTKGRIVENDTSYQLLVAIPDPKNGIVHKFTIKTDEPNFTKKHLALKIKERAAWDEFGAAFKKIINTEDVTTLRGEALAGANQFKCKIDPIDFKKKSSFNYYEEDEFLEGFFLPKNIKFSISTMLWSGENPSAKQVESGIKRVEASLDKAVGGQLQKVFYANYKNKTLGSRGGTEIGTEKRDSIKDNIFYVHSSEAKSDLTELSKNYIEVSIETSEYKTSVIITYYQLPIK